MGLDSPASLEPGEINLLNAVAARHTARGDDSFRPDTFDARQTRSKVGVAKPPAYGSSYGSGVARVSLRGHPISVNRPFTAGTSAG